MIAQFLSIAPETAINGNIEQQLYQQQQQQLQLQQQQLSPQQQLQPIPPSLPPPPLPPSQPPQSEVFCQNDGYKIPRKHLALKLLGLKVASHLKWNLGECKKCHTKKIDLLILHTNR